MGASLPDLIGRAGAPLFRRLCERVIGQPPPVIPKGRQRIRFGADMTREIRNTLTPQAILRLWQHLSRIGDMADRGGRDCLRIAARSRGQKICETERGTFKMALLAFLDHPLVFHAAEALLSKGRWGTSDRFCTVFRLVEPCSPRTLARLIDPLSDGLQRILEELTDATVYLNVDPVLIAPVLPAGAREHLHIAVGWGDSSEAIGILDGNGPGLVNLPLLRTLGITLDADCRTVMVFGAKLRLDGREQIGQLIADLTSKVPTTPQVVPRVHHQLHIFANPEALPFPPHVGIAQVGIEGIRYLPPGSLRAVERDIAFPLTARASLAIDRDEFYARAELDGVTVLRVDLRIELLPSALFPDGRVIRARLTPKGYVVESGLDVDAYIVRAWIVHLKIERTDHDLLSLAA